MAFAALMLLHDERVGGPTVVVVLDRLDLIEQVERQFKTAGLPRVTTAGSQGGLAPDPAGGPARHRPDHDLPLRGRRAAQRARQHHRDGRRGPPHHRGHASATTCATALPNARFFGLTGTPIADKDRNTFKLFGDPNDPGYVLNTYSMERSIADGASVPVHVETRLVDFHLDKAALDEAFDADGRGGVPLRGGARRRSRARPRTSRRCCSTPTASRRSAPTSSTTTRPRSPRSGMKAQVVAFDRETGRRLRDRAQPAHRRARAAARDRGRHDRRQRQGRAQATGAKYALDRAAEARVKQRFNDAEDPLAFLIVTAKLLTGFDAPIEQVMYLDKPLRKHTLFQAITRTNRRYTNPKTGQEKRHGLVVDYIGLGNQIAQALKAADPDRAASARSTSTTSLAEFEATHGPHPLAALRRHRPHRPLLRSALQAAMRAARRRRRQGRVRHATSPASRPCGSSSTPTRPSSAHAADYKWLAQVYEAIKPTKVSNALLWHRLGAKTLALVHGHISNVEVTGTGLEEVVVDPDAIEAMRAPDRAGRTRPRPRHAGPASRSPSPSTKCSTPSTPASSDASTTTRHAVYRSLAEQIERLRAQAIQNAEDSIEFLKKALEVAKPRRPSRAAGSRRRLDAGRAPARPTHRRAHPDRRRSTSPTGTAVIVDDVVRDIDTIVKQVRYTGWNETQEGDRTVRKELREVLKKYGLARHRPAVRQRLRLHPRELLAVPTCVRCEAVIAPGAQVRIIRTESGERSYSHHDDCPGSTQGEGIQNTDPEGVRPPPHLPVECLTPGRCFVCHPLYGRPGPVDREQPVRTGPEPPAPPPEAVPPSQNDERCDHEMLPGQCSYCKPPPRGLPQQVWITQGGQTFHASPTCPALRDGQRYAENLGMQVHPIVRQNVHEAMSVRGQCTACFSPADLAHYAEWKNRHR